MFKAKWNPHVRVTSIVITTDWAWIIYLAWGRRRVSSRAAVGTKAYPSKLTAHWRMWLSWVWHNQVVDRREKIVISGDPEGGHGERYAKEEAEKEALREAEKKKDAMALRIDGLQAERLQARSRKDFARADAIRDEIEKAGFKVGDVALAKLNTPTQMEPKA